MKVHVHFIAVYGVLNNWCHFRTARIKTIEKQKQLKDWEQLRACTVIPNLAMPKYRALLVGENFINKIRYKSTGSCVIYIFTPWMMLLIFIYAL